MRHRALNVLTILSLVLFVAVLAVLMRGRWFHEFGIINRSHTVYHVGYVHRGFYVADYQGVTQAYQQSHPVVARWSSLSAGPSVIGDYATARRALGFSVVRIDYSQPHPYDTFRALVIPFWAPLCLFAALPVIRLARHARRKPPPGHCRRCGYDLRASPDRCPECGAAAA